MSMGGSGLHSRGPGSSSHARAPTTPFSQSGSSGVSHPRKTAGELPSGLFAAADSAVSQEHKESSVSRRGRAAKTDPLLQYPVSTEHSGMIHDVAWNYYGNMFASAGQDGVVFIYETEEQESGAIEARRVACLAEQNSAIWKVAWGPPLHEQTLLATGSFDRNVTIFRESAGKWEKIHVNTDHENSVNCVAWAPALHGVILASCSSDGSIQLMSLNDEWKAKRIRDVHKDGVNWIEFLPSTSTGSFFAKSASNPPLTLATCGCDNQVKVFYFDKTLELLKEEVLPSTHTDIVRAVSWAPPYYHQSPILASCGNDGKVVLYTKSNEGSEEPWEKQEVAVLKGDVLCESVQWNLMGTLLVVGACDNVIRFYGQQDSGEWVLKSEKDLSSGQDEPSGDNEPGSQY